MSPIADLVRGWFDKRLDQTPASFRFISPSRAAKPSQVSRHNATALDLYRRLSPTGNMVFSPFSLRTALLMAHMGAIGETAAQMDAALRIPASDTSEHTAFADVIARSRASGRGYEMSVANALWVQDGAPLQTAFLEQVRERFDAALQIADFRDSPETARARINEWVEQETRQRIRDLIPSGGLSSDTRLVLANAIWFKGEWASPFEKRVTSDQPFYLEGGRKVRVPLMHQWESMAHMQADGFQAVDLAYIGGDLSMLVLVPDEKQGLDAVESRLSGDVLDSVVAGLYEREVELFMPRFTFGWRSFDLPQVLAGLGMPLAFERGKADFSGINGYHPPHDESLFISAVIHKAFVEVNEEGTEAAAATGMMTDAMAAYSPQEPVPIPIVRADRPFMFAIRDRRSGAILFLGRVANPGA